MAWQETSYKIVQHGKYYRIVETKKNSLGGETIVESSEKLRNEHLAKQRLGEIISGEREI